MVMEAIWLSVQVKLFVCITFDIKFFSSLIAF